MHLVTYVINGLCGGVISTAIITYTRALGGIAQRKLSIIMLVLVPSERVEITTQKCYFLSMYGR